MNRTIYRVSTWTHESKTGKDQAKNGDCLEVNTFDQTTTFDDLAQAEAFYEAIELRTRYQGRQGGTPIYVHDCKLLESVTLDEDGDEGDGTIVTYNCPDYVDPSDDEDEDEEIE